MSAPLMGRVFINPGLEDGVVCPLPATSLSSSAFGKGAKKEREEEEEEEETAGWRDLKKAP